MWASTAWAYSLRGNRGGKLCQWSSKFSPDSNHLESLFSHRWLGPTPEFLKQWVWGEAPKFAFLTRFQVTSGSTFCKFHCSTCWRVCCQRPCCPRGSAGATDAQGSQIHRVLEETSGMRAHSLKPGESGRQEAGRKDRL